LAKAVIQVQESFIVTNEITVDLLQPTLERKARLEPSQM